MATEEKHDLENSASPIIKALDWAATILPPMMIIGLIFIPFDMITMAFWGPVFIAAFISFFRLTLALLKLAVKKEPLTRRNIRQALTIALCLLVLQINGMSAASAEDFAISTARDAQTVCNSGTLCPESPAGFNCDADGSCKTKYGEYGAKYYVFYSREADGRSFRVRHRRSIDDWTIITGGVGQDLIFKRMMDDQTIENRKLD